MVPFPTTLYCDFLYPCRVYLRIFKQFSHFVNIILQVHFFFRVRLTSLQGLLEVMLPPHRRVRANKLSPGANETPDKTRYRKRVYISLFFSSSSSFRLSFAQFQVCKSVDNFISYLSKAVAFSPVYLSLCLPSHPLSFLTSLIAQVLHVSTSKYKCQ